MSVQIINGDCRQQLQLLATASVQCVVTSPPYFNLRDYGVKGQMGLEPTPAAFVAELVDLFREVRRVLRDDGVVWLNLGDSYAGSGRGGNPTLESSTLQGSNGSQEQSIIRRTRGADEVGSTARQAAVTNVGRRNFREGLKADRAAALRGDRPHTSGVAPPAGLKAKDLIGIPWRVAFALQDDGWYLRQDIVWSKPNPMPESVTDRCTKSHEYLFLLAKSEMYFFDQEAITEPIAQASIARLSQNVADQVGSMKANGGTRADRPIKAAHRKSGNQSRRPASARGIPLDGEDGAAGGEVCGSVPWEGTRRNRRSVWEVAAKPFAGEFCAACRQFFQGEDLAALRVEKVKRAGRDVRIRYCACGRHDAWVAHFATFPDTLIEPCVKAGTSEYGACTDCGAPWARVVDKELVATDAVSFGTIPDGRDFSEGGDQGSNRTRDGHIPGMATRVRQRGFEPTCDCGQTNVRPCVVLDPFGGAGTTGLVADRAKRDAVLLELNPDYAEMARQRIAQDQGLFRAVPPPAAAIDPPAPEPQMALFG